GGAIYWEGSNGFLSVCSFVNSTVNQYGGAIRWSGGNGTLSACSFLNNHANEKGGAVLWSSANGFLSACSFANNTANLYGGAIYLDYNTINVSDCSFIIYRPTNTATVTVNNLIYYYSHNYDVDYYENGNLIHSGQINDNNVTFSNLDNGKHNIDMIYNKGGSNFTNYINITGDIIEDIPGDITVDSHLSASNVYMFYNDGTKYTIKLADYKGNPIINQNIQITIANLKYNLKTDSRGYATLVLKQKAGKYKIVASFNGNSEYGPSTIVSTLSILDSPITKNKNSEIYFGGRFKVQIIDVYAKHVGAGKVVKFTIAGKTYRIKTDKNGYASLKITLKPNKKYTITTQYGKFIKKNQITVKPVLTAKNIVKKKRKTIKFYAKLVNTKGKPRAKKTIRFRFKGKRYKIKTNKKGIATLKIKNLKKGKYKIYTQYGKSKIKNTIKIK
ncbi:polymorphic outer membrane protein repeat-containing protein, partial [Methanobrevibacter olleyae]